MATHGNFHRTGFFTTCSAVTAGLCLAAAAAMVAANEANTKASVKANTTNASKAIDVNMRPMERIPPGLILGEEPPAGWTDVVMVAHPRLGAGDIDSAPSIAAKYASMFKFAILAKVASEPRADGQGKDHWLAQVAIGFGVRIKGQTMVVTSETADQYGAKLGFIGKTVLSGNERCLDDVVQVARYRQMVIFDADANMLVGEEHEKMVIRHLIWVSARTGQLATLVWLMDKGTQDRYALAEPNMQLLPRGMQEDRVIHVSSSWTGIPTPDMFALVTIPQGKPVPFSDGLAKVAGLRQFQPRDVERLATELSQILQKRRQEAAKP